MYHQWKQEVLETFCKIIDSYLFKWQPAPAFLPGESHGQRSLVGYSPEGHKESDMTEVTEHAHSCRNKDLVVLVKGESYRSVEHNREARSRSIQICPNGF